MNKRVSSTHCALALLALALAANSASAVTLVVNSNADTGGNTCGTICTLRQAINAANLTTAADTINFSFPTNFRVDANTPDAITTDVLIRPITRLPTITQPLTINGYSVQGSLVNTDATNTNAKIRIRIDGLNSVMNDIGLSVCANNVNIKGLSITAWLGAGIGFGNNQTLGNGCASPIVGGGVHGNYIGVATNGTTGAGNATGITARSAIVAVGSTAVADRNIISANNGSGVELTGDSSAGSSVRNNLIGTDRSGTLDLGNGYGLSLRSSNVTVGGSTGQNLFRHNFKAIRLFATGTVLDNDLQRNRFAGNEQMAIDLSDNGVNDIDRGDVDDADSGPNGLQNVPLITAVDRIDGGVHVVGTLDVPVTTNPVVYSIGLYASMVCHASGSGEGEIFLGTKDVSLRGNTTQSFNFNHLTATTIPTGSFLTLTVDGPDGSSEFSSCLAIDDIQFDVNSANDVVDAQGCNVVHCSLREAMNAANAHFGPDLITFEIATPATGEILIQPTSPLPTINEATTIDGYSQSGAQANTDPLISNATVRIRVDAATVTSGNALFSVCANDSVIRGLSITGMLSGNGIAIEVCETVTSGVVIAGNFIGLASDGATSAANNTGTALLGHATVGGAAPADRNVISDNSFGVRVGPGGSAVLGNLIGTDRSGTLNRGNSIGGVATIFSALNASIGSATAPNLIRFNARGIHVVSTSTAIRDLVWTHNRIFGNTSLGVDLGAAGPSINDTNDLDPGPNQMQNFPLLSKAERTISGLRVEGSLDVHTDVNNTPYVIGVYASAACDSSGFGEGERLLGAVAINFTQTTSETFSFELVTDDPLEVGVQITTTATGPDGSSEFSQCIAASDPPPTLAVTVATDVDDGTCGAHCTLREAINRANAQAGENQILFAINGNGPHEIVLGSALPVITEELVIDGYLIQSGASANAAEVGSDAAIMINLDASEQPNIFRICSSGRVEIRGLALGSANGAAIATKTNDATCNVTGPLVIRGTFFGLNPDGSPNANQTALLITDSVATIGGGALADRNLFANSSGVAVKLAGNGSNGSTVVNNLFGIGIDGITNAGNAATALELLDVANVTVAAEPSEANKFRFNQRGIVIKGTSSIGNRVFANEFSDHAGMAIDLSANGTDTDGITGNDIDDTDNGPNRLQNFPDLLSATATASTITINGFLDVGNLVSSSTLTFYESASCNNADDREGEIILDSLLVNTSTAQQEFSVTLNIPPAPGTRFFTATATGFQGQTSEFSNCLAAPSAPVSDGLFADDFE